MTRYFGGGDPQINMDNSLREINARQRRMEQRQTLGYADEDVTGAILGAIVMLPVWGFRALFRNHYRARKVARWVILGAVLAVIAVMIIGASGHAILHDGVPGWYTTRSGN